jgi:MYXO-CTERM domain-containing protein
MRVDVYAGAFIRPYLLETAPGAAGLGERCFYTAHCTTGLCLAPPDPPAFSYCSQACADGVSCSPGMECEGGTCRYPTPSPGAIGATCKAGEECVSGLCAAPAPGGAPACSVRCFPENVMPCPPGFLCDVNAGDPSRFACFAEEAAGDGGCGCGAGRIPARPGGVLLLVAAVVAAAHRKRRR